MAQFSVKIMRPTGSVLGENQHLGFPDGLACADVLVSSMRFLRDPDGEHAHGVVVVEVLAVEGAA
ncbi:hypothetical protein [Paenirhodobacter sp.]|uniref:hypothetical protein n=1 Tax=Paenirhodobacter sp. TaxID=1965326 RepID=UPI003B5081C4